MKKMKIIKLSIIYFIARLFVLPLVNFILGIDTSLLVVIMESLNHTITFIMAIFLYSHLYKNDFQVGSL